jgi:hypothetical protein
LSFRAHHTTALLRAECTRTVAVVFILLVTLAKLWLVNDQSIFVIPYSDENTFIQGARGLLDGEWLGPFGVLTLIKRPFYPIFIAGAFELGLSLLLAQQLVYLAACLVIVYVGRTAARWSRGSLVLLYAALIFNPATFLEPARVLRNNLYVSLTLLVLGGGLAVLCHCARDSRRTWLWTAVFAVALSCFWFTREEAVWILPFLLCLLGVTAWTMWRAAPHEWRRHVAVLAAPFVVVAVTHGGIAGLNWKYYGLFTITEFDTPEYRAAWGGIMRVTPATERRFARVPKEKRDRLYAVSPAFAELRNFLEGDAAEKWRIPGCKVHNVCGDRDIADAWLQWALREAIYGAGHYGSAHTLNDYYGRLGHEINAACDAGLLQCGPPQAGLLPDLRTTDIADIPASLMATAKYAVMFDGLSVQPEPSQGRESDLNIYRDITRGRLASPQEAELQLAGWAFDPRGVVSLCVRDTTGGLVHSTIRRLVRPDVYAYLSSKGVANKTALESGFEIITPCTSGCSLYAHAGDGSDWERVLPLDGSVRNITTGQLTLYVDRFEATSARTDLKYQERAEQQKREVLGSILAVYRAMMPALLALSLGVFVWLAWRSTRRRRLTPGLVPIVLVVVLWGSRVGMLAILDVALFGGIGAGPDYQMPNFALSILFTGLTCLAGYDTARKWITLQAWTHTRAADGRSP